MLTMCVCVVVRAVTGLTVLAAVLRRRARCGATCRCGRARSSLRGRRLLRGLHLLGAVVRHVVLDSLAGTLRSRGAAVGANSVVVDGGVRSAWTRDWGTGSGGLAVRSGVSTSIGGLLTGSLLAAVVAVQLSCTGLMVSLRWVSGVGITARSLGTRTSVGVRTVSIGVVSETVASLSTRSNSVVVGVSTSMLGVGVLGGVCSLACGSLCSWASCMVVGVSSMLGAGVLAVDLGVSAWACSSVVSIGTRGVGARGSMVGTGAR